MTERKTLNRYYPIDFDPKKIPKLKRDQKEKNKLWGIRVMAPFNMRCNTCGEYVYKGKKFNSKKETVEDEDYLGIQIHRFYIRCPRCVAVIAFKTDPEHCDYICEAGATRNFEAAKTLQDMEKKKQKEIEEEEANNPMKVLENRTKQSRNEMETIEALTELREMNARHEKVDYEGMIHKMGVKEQLTEEEIARREMEEEDRIIKELFGARKAEHTSDGSVIRRIADNSSESDDDEDGPPKAKSFKPANPTDLLTTNEIPNEDVASTSTSDMKPKPSSTAQRKTISSKSALAGLVKVKKPTNDNSSKTATADTNGQSSSNDVDKHQSVPNNRTDCSKQTANNSSSSTNNSAAGNALGLLGGYGSFSDGDSDSN